MIPLNLRILLLPPCMKRLPSCANMAPRRNSSLGAKPYPSYETQIGNAGVPHRHQPHSRLRSSPRTQRLLSIGR